jgi:RNA polymerase sigma-B factor
LVNPVFVGEQSPALFGHACADGSRRAAADRLVTAHQHLCRRGARKFWRSGLERCDLEQVAAVGLIKASRRYDPAASTPFEAYAWMTIVGELMHYVRDHERAVRVPRRLKALEPHFNRALEVCGARLGHEPSDAELAAEMGILEHTVAEIRRVRVAAAMLPLDDPGARAIACDPSIAIEDRMLVDAAFARLSLLERRIVVGVYVLGLTQLELGRTLGLSSRRVSRVRHAALARMQRAWVP